MDGSKALTFNMMSHGLVFSVGGIVVMVGAGGGGGASGFGTGNGWTHYKWPYSVSHPLFAGRARHERRRRGTSPKSISIILLSDSTRGDNLFVNIGR